MKFLPEANYPCPATHLLSYKERVRQIFTRQLPYAFSVYSTWYGAWWYWLLIPYILPFQIAYCCVMLVELLFITILLPIAYIPYVGVILQFVVQTICFIVGYIIAFLGFIPQKYEKFEKMRELKNLLIAQGIKRNLRKIF